MAQTVTVLPSIGDVVPGRDVAGRELRISGHPGSDRVVLSIWQDGRCQATVRLARSDVPEVTRALVASLVPLPAPTPDDGHSATVHPFRPGTEAPLTAAALRAATERMATAVATRIRKFTIFR